MLWWCLFTVPKAMLVVYGERTRRLTAFVLAGCCCSFVSRTRFSFACSSAFRRILCCLTLLCWLCLCTHRTTNARTDHPVLCLLLRSVLLPISFARRVHLVPDPQSAGQIQRCGFLALFVSCGHLVNLGGFLVRAVRAESHPVVMCFRWSPVFCSFPPGRAIAHTE